MRVFKTQEDIQRVLNQLLDESDLKRSKDWDFHGLRIKNASPSKDDYDYVVRKELTPSTTINQVIEADYTAVFCRDTPTDNNESPPYNAGTNRSGNIIDVWVAATGAPDTDCSVNFKVGGVTLLTSNLVLPAGTTAPVHSSAFVTPIPKIGYDTKITMVIVTAGGVTLISGGVVVRRDT